MCVVVGVVEAIIVEDAVGKNVLEKDTEIARLGRGRQRVVGNDQLM